MKHKKAFLKGLFVGYGLTWLPWENYYFYLFLGVISIIIASGYLFYRRVNDDTYTEEY